MSNGPAWASLIPGTIIDFSVTNYFGVMSILIGFVCLLLAGFLLVVPSARKIPNRFLAVFLILTAIEISGWLWVTVNNQTSWLNAFRGALGLLQMSVFFGFFVSSCYSDFRLNWRDSLHLLPFVMGLLLTLPGNQIPGAAKHFTSSSLTREEIDAMRVAAHLLYYGYMAAICQLLWVFYRRFTAVHSGGRSEVLVWLIQLAATSLFAHTLILVRDIAIAASASRVSLGLQLFGALLVLCILTWIALKSLLQPHLFRDVDRKLLGLSDDAAIASQSNLARLQEAMENDRPYLNPDLSLSALAEQVGMVSRDVSALLNQHLGVHFFDFVNGYRVRDAQSMLLAHKSRSVLEVLHAVGFNSKSSFNTAFKKHTGMTPSAYRKKGGPAASHP